MNGYDLLFKQYEQQSRLNEFGDLLEKAKTIFKNNIKLFYYESLYLFRKKNTNNHSILTNESLEKSLHKTKVKKIRQIIIIFLADCMKSYSTSMKVITLL